MGQLIYANGVLVVDFDDRVLAHLQFVIIAKLRRRESLWLTWTNEASAGSGRDSVWLDAHVALRFTYSVSTVPLLSRDWIELLSGSANSNSGLHVLPEPLAGTPSRATAQ